MHGKKVPYEDGLSQYLVSSNGKGMSASNNTAAPIADEIRQVPSEQLEIAHDYSMFSELEKLGDNQEELRKELDYVEESCQEVVLWSSKEDFHRLVESALAPPSSDAEVVRGHRNRDDDLIKVFLSQTATVVFETGGRELSAQDLQQSFRVDDDDRNPSPAKRSEKAGAITVRDSICHLVAAASVDEDPQEIRRNCSANLLHLAPTVSADNRHRFFEPMKVDNSMNAPSHCDTFYQLVATATTEEDDADRKLSLELRRRNINTRDSQLHRSDYQLLATVTVDDEVDTSLETVRSILEESDLSSSPIPSVTNTFEANVPNEKAKPTRMKSFLWSCLVTWGKFLYQKKPSQDSSDAADDDDDAPITMTRPCHDETQPLLQSC